MNLNLCCKAFQNFSLNRHIVDIFSCLLQIFAKKNHFLSKDVQKLWEKCLQIFACSVVIQNEADIKNWCCHCCAPAVHCEPEQQVLGFWRCKTSFFCCEFGFWRCRTSFSCCEFGLSQEIENANSLGNSQHQWCFSSFCSWRFPEIRIGHSVWMVANGLHGEGKIDASKAFWIQFWECKILPLQIIRFLN